MKFIQKEFDSNLVEDLSKECNISKNLATLLVERDIKTKEQVDRFFSCSIGDLDSPSVFPQINEIVDKIKKAITEKKKIIIYGDYDCDGIGAIAILYLLFKDHNVNVDVYIPDRFAEGYGLHNDSIDQIIEKYAPDLMITVDCGITSVDAISYAISKGLDVIVTDHHTPLDTLPDCLIMNPWLCSGATPYCGAGVALMLGGALFGLKSAFKYVDICAMSTIADMVPLVKDNRTIVKLGLEKIHQGIACYGINYLISHYIHKERNGYELLTTSDVSFYIAPRINSAGRIDSPYVALNIFIGEDKKTIEQAINDIERFNQTRKEMVEEVVEDVINKIKSYDFSKYRIIMLKGTWADGIIGIAAQKLVETYNMPTILLCNKGDGLLKGSSRSIDAINIFELYNNNKEKLVTYGGHAKAAGVTIREEDFDEVLETFNNYIISKYDDSVFNKIIKYDLELEVSKITRKDIQDIQSLEPNGIGNPEPVFFDSSNTTVFDKMNNKNHVKAHLKMIDNADIVGFNVYNLISALNKYNFSYTFNNINYYKGRTTYNFKLNDIEPVELNVPYIRCLENYCSTFISYTRDTYPQKANDKPHLYVAYDINLAKQFVKEHKDIKVVCYTMEKLEPIDTLVISPRLDSFPFWYFGKVEFLNVVGESILNAIAQQGSKAINGKESINLPSIKKDELRNIYVAIRRIIQVSNRFSNLADLYFISSKHYSLNLSYEQFVLGLTILMELRLIIIQSNGIIRIDKKQTEIEESILYQLQAGNGFSN